MTVATATETTGLRVLVLEDDQRRIDIFREKLRGHAVTYVETAADCIDLLESEEFDVIFLDHDLGGQVYVSTDDPNTGSEVVRWMLVRIQTVPLNQPYVIIHSMNTPAAESMESRLKLAEFEFVYRIPFRNLVISYFDDPSFLS